MTRLATFDQNVTSPIVRAIVAGRSKEDLLDIVREVIGLACPYCGHLTPDHSWTPDADGLMRCLVRQNGFFSESEHDQSETPVCECPGLNGDKEPGEDQDVFEALTRMELLFGVVIDHDQEPRLHNVYQEQQMRTNSLSKHLAATK